jgi:hypothetical protein
MSKTVTKNKPDTIMIDAAIKTLSELASKTLQRAADEMSHNPEGFLKYCQGHEILFRTLSTAQMLRDMAK